MNINITIDAYNDISTFYENAIKAHPNTFSQEQANTAIDFVYNGIVSRLNGVIGNEREPLLQNLRQGKTIELTVDRGRQKLWYFTARIVNDNVLVENAWYFANASNRAFRRGISNPQAPLSTDDRTTQGRTTITESQLRRIIRESIKKVLSII